jgi:hypothetical protein
LQVVEQDATEEMGRRGKMLDANEEIDCREDTDVMGDGEDGTVMF